MIEINIKGETISVIKNDILELCNALGVIAPNAKATAKTEKVTPAPKATPKAEEPTPEAKPAPQPEAVEEEQISLEEMQKKVAAYGRAHGKEKVKAALEEHGAPKLSAIPEQQRSAFLASLGVM